MSIADVAIFLGSCCAFAGTFMQAWIDTGELRAVTAGLENPAVALEREHYVLQAKELSRFALLSPWVRHSLREDARTAVDDALSPGERAAILAAGRRTTAWSILSVGTLLVAGATAFQLLG